MLKAACMSIVVGTLAIGTSTAAMSQVVRPFQGAPRQALDEQHAPDSISPVSPYLNLGVSAGGLSNYAALVRPLVQEREARRRQALATRQAATLAPAAQAQKERSAGALTAPRRPPGRFLNYSHYFGDAR